MTPPVPYGFPHLGYGVGLRDKHYTHVLENQPDVDWFEIVSENFLSTDGRPLYILDRVAERYPIVMHGVSMSIGTTDPIDFDYLRQLKNLAHRCDAKWISDHICWTGLAHASSHDLLPVPYNDDTLAHLVERVRIIQDYMERPLGFENASSYLEFVDTTMTEWDFLRHLCDETGCFLLLDVNNIYVSCYNHGWDRQAYLDGVPWERVVQFHLAGHFNEGTHIIDTHSDHVIDEVWDMYKVAHERSGGRSTLIEWDYDIPAFDVVHAEVLEARNLVEPGASAGSPDASAAPPDASGDAPKTDAREVADAVGA